MNAISVDTRNPYLVSALWLVILLGLGLLLAKMYFYKLHGDDPWFAEQAYWLAKDGVVRSEFFSSMLDYGTQQFAYHKLHIWIAALAIKLFGLSHLTLDFITLSFYCLLLLVSRKYFFSFYGDQAGDRFLIFLAFMLINSLATELAFVYRPEMAMTCFGFISYYFLRKSFEAGAEYPVIAGVFAGLCVLLHLNGLIFIAAGATLLLVNKKVKYMTWFILAAVCVASLYFIDVLPNHWATYWMQFRHDPAIPKNQFSLQSLVQRIVFEYERFFRHGYESGYSLFLFAVIIADRKAIWKQAELRDSLIYFIALTLTLAAISPGKTHYSILFAMPYAGILVAASLGNVLIHSKKNFKNRVLIGFGFLYVLANVPHALAIINDGMGEQDLVQNNAEVMKRFNMQRGDKVLAPLPFIFNALEKVSIEGTDAFFMRAARGYVRLSAKTFFQEALDNHRKFILIQERQLQLLDIMPTLGKDYDGYTYLGVMHDYHVFRKSTSTR